MRRSLAPFPPSTWKAPTSVRKTDRARHPRQHVHPPDWDEFRRFQEASGGRIRLVTLAPEHDGALPFIEKLTASGVVVALGHTAADGPRIHEAVRTGARLSTHLGNGCHAVLPRHANPIWEQLAADELWASAICDGWHLTPAVARCIVRRQDAGAHGVDVRREQLGRPTAGTL